MASGSGSRAGSSDVAFGPGWDGFIGTNGIQNYKPCSMLRGNPAFATGTNVINQMRAFPFILARQTRIVELVFEVTTGGAAGSVGRAGIYVAGQAEAGNLSPDALEVDGGEFDCTVIGRKTAAIDVTLDKGVYWATILTGVAAPTVRTMTAANFNCFLGYNAASPPAAYTSFSVAQAYGALPAIWPGGGSPDSAAVWQACWYLPTVAA